MWRVLIMKGQGLSAGQQPSAIVVLNYSTYSVMVHFHTTRHDTVSLDQLSKLSFRQESYAETKSIHTERSGDDQGWQVILGHSRRQRLSHASSVPQPSELCRHYQRQPKLTPASRNRKTAWLGSWRSTHAEILLVSRGVFHSLARDCTLLH
jgi:hypothetical protein